jgi:hypothetical protein
MFGDFDLSPFDKKVMPILSRTTVYNRTTFLLSTGTRRMNSMVTRASSQKSPTHRNLNRHIPLSTQNRNRYHWVTSQTRIRSHPTSSQTHPKSLTSRSYSQMPMRTLQNDPATLTIFRLNRSVLPVLSSSSMKRKCLYSTVSAMTLSKNSNVW